MDLDGDSFYPTHTHIGELCRMMGGGLLLSTANILARTSTNSVQWSIFITGE
jgi:hypothetical protein